MNNLLKDIQNVYDGYVKTLKVSMVPKMTMDARMPTFRAHHAGKLIMLEVCTKELHDILLKFGQNPEPVPEPNLTGDINQ
jgi:hypothetical protein